MSVIIPPASSTIIEPAAKSHGDSEYSKNMSIVPDATEAKSREAAPERLISRVLMNILYAVSNVA